MWVGPECDSYTECSEYIEDVVAHDVTDITVYLALRLHL